MIELPAKDKQAEFLASIDKRADIARESFQEKRREGILYALKTVRDKSAKRTDKLAAYTLLSNSWLEDVEKLGKLGLWPDDKKGDSE